MLAVKAPQIQRLEVFWADPNHPWCLTSEELSDHLGDFNLSVRVPLSPSLVTSGDKGIKGLLVVFLQPTSYVPGGSQQLPTNTMNSVGGVLLPPLEALDSLPELLSRPTDSLTPWPPNYSQAAVFASATAQALECLVCRNPSLPKESHAVVVFDMGKRPIRHYRKVGIAVAWVASKVFFCMLPTNPRQQ